MCAIPPAARPTLIRPMDTGSLTCAHIWVRAVHTKYLNYIPSCSGCCDPERSSVRVWTLYNHASAVLTQRGAVSGCENYTVTLQLL